MRRSFLYGVAVGVEDVLFSCCFVFVFFFNDTATTEIYTLSLHDALPICLRECTLPSRFERNLAMMFSLLQR